METAIKELEILEQIHSSQSDVRQRALAEIAGLSLGMTNAIVKRLAEKGWITVRKVNGRNLAYAVTPEGMEVIATRSYGYLKRTIKSVVLYRRKIEELARQIRSEGYRCIVLIGKSDLDFIVEHGCAKSGLLFRKEQELPAEGGAEAFFLFSEDIRPEAGGRPKGVAGSGERAERGEGASAGRAYLQELLRP